MTVTLAFRFPWGRYHATPWARHVNEGAVELPPSPWRLLRALYAVWRTRVPELDADTVHGLLTKLATPPTAYVPPHTFSHTRHYYPDSTHTRSVTSTDATLDTFAVLDRNAELALQWRGITLTPDEHDALAKIAIAVPYLGRADSICEARLAHDWAATDHDVWEPVDAAEFIPDNADVARVLAPDLPLRMDSLTARPVDIRRHNLLYPAGTKLMGYQRTFMPARRRRHRRITHSPVTAVRFAVAQRSYPSVRDTLIYTDLLRASALAKLGRQRQERQDTLLAGRRADGSRTDDDHRHAHYLPVTEPSGRITDLLVWVPAGLSDDELEALTDVTHLRSPFMEKWRLTVRVAGLGAMDDIAPELVGPSRAWTTLTPFVPSRYAKKRHEWSEFVHREVTRELTYRSFSDLDVDLTVHQGGPPVRKGRPTTRDDRRRSAHITLRTQRPIRGPLALGHNSHFGMGLFLPTTDPG